MHIIRFDKGTVVTSRICVAMLLLLSVVVPSRHVCCGCPIESIDHLSGSGNCCRDCFVESHPCDVSIEAAEFHDGTVPLSCPSPVSGRCPLCGDKPFSTDNSVSFAVEARSVTLCVDRQSMLINRFHSREVFTLMACLDTKQNHSVSQSVAARNLPLRL